MTDRFEKSMQTLELPRVLDMLADQAVTEEGKDKARRLRPETDPVEVTALLAETTAAVEKMVLRRQPRLCRGAAGGRVPPAGGHGRQPEHPGAAGHRQGAAPPPGTAKEYGEADAEKKAPIDVICSMPCAPNRFLEDKITGSILGDGRDRRLRQPGAGVHPPPHAGHREQGPGYSAAASSPPTSPSICRRPSSPSGPDRYVVPVKSEHKNDIPGLVHDVSASGSTFFIEPMGVVKANNELRELQAKEEKEIERILAELSAECGRLPGGHPPGLSSCWWRLDVIFARAKLSLQHGAPWRPGCRARCLNLRRARHPLLDQKKAVPIDLRAGGGLRHPGHHRPQHRRQDGDPEDRGPADPDGPVRPAHPRRGRQRAVQVFAEVLADIGDEQSIDQSLSTFSSHMTNIVGILEEADDETPDPASTSWARAPTRWRARPWPPPSSRTLPEHGGHGGGHHPLRRAEGLRHDAPRGWRTPPASSTWRRWRPTYRLLHRHARQVQRLCHLPAAGPAGVHHRQGRGPAWTRRTCALRTCITNAGPAAPGAWRRSGEQAAQAPAWRWRSRAPRPGNTAEQLEEERDKAMAKAQAEAQAHHATRPGRTAEPALSELKRACEEGARRSRTGSRCNDQRAEAAPDAQRGGARSSGGQTPGARRRPRHPPGQAGRHGGAAEDGHPGHGALREQGRRHCSCRPGILKHHGQAGRGPRGGRGDPAPSEGRASSHRAGAEHTLRTAGRPSRGGPAGHDHRTRPLLTLDQFLDDAPWSATSSQVTVIHGKGTGAVRKAVHTHLKR